MLTGDKIQGFIEEQADMQHTVRKTLESMGFDVLEEVETIDAICTRATRVGMEKAARVAMQRPVEFDDGGPMAPLFACALASALESFLVGLAAGYAVGLRDQP